MSIWSIPEGKIIGIVGESGCGKSTLISAIIRLLAPNARVVRGTIVFKGNDLFSLSPEQMRGLRGNEISMVFQDPMTSLNPVLTIGRQMADVQHRSTSSRAEKKARSLMMLERVGIPDPATQLERYPHHLSGGMRQRVAIAMALMTEPSLLIADEPTTALDATLEVQIIHRLRELQRDFGCSILFISHHLGVIAELCDEVVVMYAGEVVESGASAGCVLGIRDIPIRKNCWNVIRPGSSQRTRRPAGHRGQPAQPGRTCRAAAYSGSAAHTACRVAARNDPTLAGGAHQAACHLLEPGGIP